MAEVTGTEKIGKVAADLMDVIDAHLSECGGEVVNVLIAAEVDAYQGEDTFVQMLVKSTTDSPVYQRGLAHAAAGVVGSNTYSSESGDGEVDEG